MPQAASNKTLDGNARIRAEIANKKRTVNAVEGCYIAGFALARRAGILVNKALRSTGLVR